MLSARTALWQDLKTLYLLMFKKYIFLIVLLIGCALTTAEAQQKSVQQNLLQGRLIDAENAMPIPFAHITNLSKGLRTVSDSSGLFTLPATSGDSLQISSVSYGQKKIVVPVVEEGKRLLIELAPNVYELNEVVVKRFPSEREFARQILSMEAPKDNGPDMRLPNRLPPGEQIANNGAPTLAFGGAISGLAGKFSKKERGRAFIAEMQVKDARKAVIETKYNREIVREITGLEDEDQLEAFMQYCVLAENFLYEASEYEIHKAVLACFGDFVKEQEG